MDRFNYSSLAKHLKPFILTTAEGATLETVRSGRIVHVDIQGRDADDHPQYFLADGTRDISGNLNPALPDTYDLGSSVKLWRKAWISELDAVVFAKNTVTLLGGWLVVGKNEGTLAADVAAADTTVDFGQAMTTGHFVLFRAAGAVEYMQVGSVTTGTIYNVTRNLDGTGANAWSAGTPYAVLGTTGDGRIELNAYDSPRISIIRQGATYNDQTEVVRIGDLNSSFGVSGERYGFAVGDYSAGNYLKYDPTDDFMIHVGGGDISLHDGGIDFSSYAVGETAKSLHFNEGGTRFATIEGKYDLTAGTGYRQISMYADGHDLLGEILLHAEADAKSMIHLFSAGDGTGGASQLALTCESGASDAELTADIVHIASGVGGYLELNADEIYIYSPDTIDLIGPQVRVEGELHKGYSGGYQAGYIFVPLTTPLTSTSWDGDSYSTTARTLIDLSAVFGAPAGVKAVLVRTLIRDSGSAASDCAFSLTPNSGSGPLMYTHRCSGLTNDAYSNMHSIIPCDANGDIYYQIAASGASTMDITLQVWGYYI